MMGYGRLCLLLCLSSYTLAQDVNEQTSTCLLTSRFKAAKRYVYQYTTESRNGAGTTHLTNGPKVSCQVEIEVPQPCRFVMHTRACVLGQDPHGQPGDTPPPTAEAFQAAMEKNPLKVTVDDFMGTQLYPETEEPVNILNIKRGIVSVLMVPAMEEMQNSLMSTAHGQCSTDVRVSGSGDVSLSRDLSQCDQFHSRELANSPLALLQKLHNPISKLITSTQDCTYQFDNKGKHITTAMCTEKHVYPPLLNEDNEISSSVTQEISFQSSKRLNARGFDVDSGQRKPLHFEDPGDKGPPQMKDTALSTLQELVALAGTDQGHQRPGLFHKLVSSLRALRNETLSQALPEMLGASGWLTWQALFQCGTPECTSAILQAIRTIDGVSLEVDALIYGLSLQADPDAARVRDMLSMAQYKQSKAIMYALASTVKKFHKGEVTPVVTDVSKFMETILNDCSGEILDDESDFPPDPEEMSFLVLRVVGVMGQAMQDVSPSLISSILRCAQKTDTPLSNQKAAIQAFRLMDINDEVRTTLMEVYQDTDSPVEKRIAAFLVLMKNPDQTLVNDVVNSLENVRDEQLKSFVVSHLNNIYKSDEPQLYQVKEYIELALKDELSPTNKVFDGMSRNYRMDSPLGSVQSNIIFDGKDTLPKELMLETTLKVFDYNYDIFEVDIEGSGFEPTIDALFGEKGFFPDSISRVMYWAGDKAQMLSDVLDKIAPNRDRMKRQVPQDLLQDITNRVQGLMDHMQSSQAPEAIAYLRLLGNEIGYLKTSEMRKMVETLNMYYYVFVHMLPVKAFFQLISSTENEVFAHYIFMENTFSLPTASGFPLKFSLAGVLAPGAKGGLTSAKGGLMTDLSFMPSVGLEFITHMAVQVPDYVDAGLEMHTNMYHESSLNAKVTVSRNQLRLSIPAPTSNTQLLSISNKLLSVSSGQTKIVASPVEDWTDSTDCQPLFSGLKLCTIRSYPSGTSWYQALYNSLAGETRYAVEIQPTGGISEYTATISDETIKEGKRGRHKEATLKLTLKAEGDDSTEATALLKYSRNRNTFATEIVIPDYDVEAGIKVFVTDSDTKGKKMKGLTIDFTNRNIPQLTLIGQTRLDMKDAMLQLQMNIASLETDASVTATLKTDEAVLMDLETVINLPETSYQQRASVRYDDDKFEVELRTDLNSGIQKLIPDLEDYHRQLQHLIDDILDQRVAKTDMKLRHIVIKGIEAGNIWLDKLTARVPYLANLRSKRSIPELTLPALPEKLFLDSDSLFRYQFNKDKGAISLPVPLGGKKSEELNIPTILSIPLIDLPMIGLYIPANNYAIPSITIPPSLDFTVPLLGLFEISTKINSNVYCWEGSISGGNNTVDIPSYIAQYKAMAQSPLKLLSYKLEGTGMMLGRTEDNIKYLLNSSFSHSLIDTSFSVLETLRVTNKLNARANYKIEASSPVGLQASIYYSAHSMSTLNTDEVSGDGTLDGLLKIGPFNTNASYTHNYNLRPLEREGRGESTLHFDSPFIQIHNMIQGVYANSEMKVISKTSTQKDIFKHIAELKYKDAQLILNSNALATVMDKVLTNKVEFGVSSHMAILRIESQADDIINRAYSLITGSLNSNGLELNSEGSLTFDIGRGLHKSSVMVDRNGLTTTGTNSIQCSPVIVENTFSGALDNNGASLSSRTKAMSEESRGELNIEGKVTTVEASLNGVLKGNVHDAITKNIIDIVMNRRSLTFTSNTMGALDQKKTENSHVLTLTLWTLKLSSKTNNFICEDIYYKQDTNVDMKPFVMSFHMTNDLKFYEASLNNEGHMKLQPMKVDLSGSMGAAYGGENNIKQTYELTYDNLAGTIKSSMSGEIMDAQLSYDCELEFAGPSSKSKCDAQINSQPLRFEGNIRTLAQPFSFTLDALVNSDGEINLYGKHNGQLYSKLLVQAEPLALALSHDSQVSTTHMLPSGESSTNLGNKFDGLLTPSDQYLIWKVTSKLNNHAYNQDISTYNNPENIGFEFSGAILTDIFNKLKRNKRSVSEIEEYSMAGFLKYDKHSDCHIIEIPFINNLPIAFEQLKNTLVQALESLQQFINNLEIDQLITDFRAKLDWLVMQVSDFMQDIDLENKVNQVKEKLDYLFGEFAVTIDDLELVMNNLSKNLENTVMDIATKIRDLILIVKDYLNDVNVTNAVSKIGNLLQTTDEKYKIKQSFVKALNAIEDIIRQIDLQKLTESSAAWLRELDSDYRILETIKGKVSEMKNAIENFDINMFFQDLTSYLLSTDLATFVEQLSYKIPSSEIAKVIESMNDVIVNWIDEYEIPNKFNAVYTYIRDLLLKYHFDEKFKDLMDQTVILIKEFNIEKTVQSVVDALKSINFEVVYDKIMHFLHSVTSQLRAIDLKKSIDDINEQISLMVTSIKEFDYSRFVDETNKNIRELTHYINKQVKTYDIVQKIEAFRDFLREIQSSVFTFLSELKNTKVADALKKLKNVIDTTFYNDIKMKVQDILEDMRQRILDMNIRDEMYIHLQRASESYSNMVAYISAQFNQLIQMIRETMDNQLITQIKEAVDGVLAVLRRPEIEVSTFIVPFTDLAIPAFSINLNKLHEITIPAQMSVPEFTILNSYTVPAFVIDFDEIKAMIITIIDDLGKFEVKMPDPVEIFGDLKVLYLSELPDLTFPEITLSEITFPAINIPTLNLEDFQITVLAVPEIKLPEVSRYICFPLFGKLHGEFRVNSPQYNLITTGKIENSTSTPKTPQFTAAITSHVESPIEPLKYTFEATAQLGAPRMKKLLFTETVKATHMAFSIDHEGSLTLTDSSAEASAKTTAKATTQMFTADLVNNMALGLNSGISATIDTSYNHNLEITAIETSSQASVKQNIVATIESDRISVIGETSSEGKWSIKDYSDEGIHTSNVELNVNVTTARLRFSGETDCKALKSKQALTAESVILSHLTFEARCETEVPSVKSVMVLNGETHIGDLKVALTASHDVEFTGSVVGSMSNSLEFVAYPFEIVLDVKNKANSKISLPLKLTGKVDLLNDYGVTLNSDKQHACWFASARFNQYKYAHNFTAENNEMDILFHSSANGEANLDFLTVPLSIPNITIPFLEIKIPEVRDLSLWEKAGFKILLTTPQQAFDIKLKFHYYKNPDMHSSELQLEPIYSSVRDNANIIYALFEQCRDKAVALLKQSYNQAKSQYIKHKKDTSSRPPRIFTVPGYKIPVLNVAVSAFSAEIPAFSYFVPKEVSTPSFKVPAIGFHVPSYTLVLPSLGLPVIDVPETLREIKLPTFTLPAIQNNIMIPAMGNITCDFSLKTTLINLNANAGLYNQSDVVARFGGSSTSVFDILNGKFDGTTSLTRKRGIKLATTVAIDHNNVKATHDCAFSLTKRSMEASVANSAKVSLPSFSLELNQELTTTTKTKPNLAANQKLKYMFNIPLIQSLGQGNLDIFWALEALSSHLSLETSDRGMSDITIMGSYDFSGDLENEASFNLNGDHLRSTVRTVLNSSINKRENRKRNSNNNILQFDLNKNLALEVSERMFATVDYTSNNNVNLGSFNTNGRHIVKGELDFVPYTTFKTMLNIDASQPSSLGYAGLTQSINLAVTSEKQFLTWSGKERLASLIHAGDLSASNDESEVRMDLSGSVEGHLAFLNEVNIPVYQKTLWDVLKFDQVTDMGSLQFLNMSASIAYTKAMDAYEFAIPSNIFKNGITFNIPYLRIAMPSWIEEISHSLKNTDNVTDHLTDQKTEIALHLPTSVFIPVFGALSTTLKVSSPIYTASTTATLEKKDSSLVTSMNSICTSTMIFLEYDFTASATLGFDNGVISLGKCKLLHNDVNVYWQHNLAQNLRMKRQTPLDDLRESRNTLDIDITSQTFADLRIRFASQKNGITASVSSPSSGFLGFNFHQRSPSQLYGKLFSRYPSTPEKDIDVFNSKATLKNTEKLILQMSWNQDFFHDVIEGTKDRIPVMTNAVFQVIDKYHTAHFGFDLNRGSRMLKNTISHFIEGAYHEVSMYLNTLLSSIENLLDQGKNMYLNVSDSLMSFSVQEFIDRLAHKARHVLKQIDDYSRRSLGAHWFISRTTESASQRFIILMEKISELIRASEFTIPGTDVVINGNEIMDKMTFSSRSIYLSLQRGLTSLHKTVNDFLQGMSEKGEDFITYLKDKNVEFAPQADMIYTEVLQSSKQHVEEAKAHMADYKELTKLKIQEAYRALTMESFNDNAKGVINVSQSYLYGGLHESLDLMRRTAQSTAPYIRVTNKKTDIEIPLPFLWKSFSEWPMQSK